MTEEMRKQVGERIREARKRKGLSQEQLAEKLGLTFQAVSTWETGKFIPDSDHLPALAKELDLSLNGLFAEKEHRWEYGPVNFDPDHMFTFVKGRAQMLGLKQALQVLDLLKKAHEGQKRRSRYGFETEYIAHPLTMACQALAMGIREDEVIAVCLAHDMVEDSRGRVKLADLPEGHIRNAVRLLSKNECPHTGDDWMAMYYKDIRKNPLASLVKVLDRVNNVAGMADAFSRDWMIRYAGETARYYPALLEEIKKVPEWNDAWWLLRYQLTTQLETYKRLL